MRTTRRILMLAATLVVIAAAPAAAHVNVRAVTPPHHGFAVVAFRVPNERDDAGTVKLEVTFPATPALTSASVQPVPGWKAEVVRDGERAASITWSGGRIAPGEFQEFPVSIGQLPEDTESLTFKAVQTYDDGEVVRWIDIASADNAEPEHPAPVLELTAADDHASGEHASATNTGDDGDDAPIAAYALSAAALGLSVVALSRTRRRPTT